MASVSSLGQAAAALREAAAAGRTVRIGEDLDLAGLDDEHAVAHVALADDHLTGLVDPPERAIARHSATSG